MITTLLNFFSNYLIESMTLMAVVALSLRWMAFHHSKRDEAYFSHFTRELGATINEDKSKKVECDDTEDYLSDILGRVNQRLPERNLRKPLENRLKKGQSETVGLREYIGSKHGLIANIQNESNIFMSRAQPDFSSLTERVMNDDENWSKLFTKIPIDGVTRILDIMPTLFIVLGVFGTFIGIANALPEIAKIDFNNLEASGESLSQFVINVTFAMKTSIAGIFYSIILTLLNTLFPIESSREGTFEKVETVLQLLWYHLQKDQTSASMEKEIPKLRETMELILAELRKKPESLKKVG
ncbi:hypothetical protein [Halobacteriovorax sp. HLS]|uniref:hypothetical protein n=1 Tax=Halobacteriovorax sp. HLS TaxID=2234000 RepID=UPI000FDAD036|nr:hypothetical protein [Halobacteriovorax sp. HLS]